MLPSANLHRKHCKSEQLFDAVPPTELHARYFKSIEISPMRATRKHLGLVKAHLSLMEALIILRKGLPLSLTQAARKNEFICESLT
ncbi:hypothetical protein K443DRAFT_71 [Laccaria amethystina LaAM-08-1]|uniref:Uncharacterized protein n=1 Tax=Laccaria amethystina LaAM-08-1 TaxID=1095629 RepID=A0A0C9YIE8_9AGAR|nr:hypothetical protein K443DRAFT_71 [Laccaria amethystina LaAM-08-1]